MPENKIIPVTMPKLEYNVAPTDIGSGYAAGITSAGKSLAGAITGIMGGVDAQGNPTHGLLEQNQTVNDTLSWLSSQKNPDGTPVLNQDAYNSIMGKSLGARQQVVGALMGQFQTNLKTQQELAYQQKLEAAKASIAAPYRIQEIQETGRQTRLAATAGREATGERKVILQNPNQNTTSQNAGQITTSLGSALMNPPVSTTAPQIFQRTPYPPGTGGQ